MGQFVNVLLGLHTEYTELVLTTFQGDQAFYGSRDKVTFLLFHHYNFMFSVITTCVVPTKISIPTFLFNEMVFESLHFLLLIKM